MTYEECMAILQRNYAHVLECIRAGQPCDASRTVAAVAAEQLAEIIRSTR